MASTAIDEFDIVIIGAGIMGLSAAHYLSESGMKVCITERESYAGGHTTLRCAGGIRQQFSSPLNIELAKLNRRLISDLERKCQCALPFNPCGYSFAFTNSASAVQAEKIMKMQREMSVDVKALSSNEIADIFANIRNDDILLATYSSDDGLLDVGKLLGLLKTELHKRNVRILCRSAVRGIEIRNGRIDKVLLDRNEIKTSAVVNAAGPWAGWIGEMAGVYIPVKPSLQQLWVTEPIPWLRREMPVLIFNDEGIGFHWEAGGLLSGYHKPYTKAETLFPQIDLDWEIMHCEKAVERVPNLYNRQIASRWAGFYETTVDDFPIVGPCGPSGLYCIAGFNGHGITQGLACGYLLSRIMTGKSAGLDMSSLELSRINKLGFERQEEYFI